MSHPDIVFAKWPEYDVQELLKESNLLITDYSSIAMDFAYMKKPLLYYQFDYEMFRKGHYREGYFSYLEDGFGAVCTNMEELFKQLHRLVERGLKIEPVYEQRSDQFYERRDQNNSERNYLAIKEIQ